MTPNAAYNLILDGDDKCMIVEGPDGSRLKNYQGYSSPSQLLEAFKRDVDSYRELGSVWIYTGTVLSSCNNKNGRRYKIDFNTPAAQDKQTGAASPGSGNNEMFKMMLDMQKEHTKQMSDMQSKLFEQRIGALETKKKSNDWTDPETINAMTNAVEKLAPIAAKFMFKGGGGVGAGQQQQRKMIAGAPVELKEYKKLEAKDNEQLQAEITKRNDKVAKLIGPVDFIALLDFMLQDSAKALKLVYAINANPALLDIAPIAEGNPGDLEILINGVNDDPKLLKKAVKFLSDD